MSSAVLVNCGKSNSKHFQQEIVVDLQRNEGFEHWLQYIGQFVDKAVGQGINELGSEY